MGLPNITRDCLVMILHLVVWSIVIMMIEKGWLTICCPKSKARKSQDAEELDDDVLKEA
jgi:hypothetical protein